MSNNEVGLHTEEKMFEVITYDEEVEFKYTLPGEDQERVIESELTFVWEDSIDKLKEKLGEDKEYKVHTFKLKSHYDFFINQVESRADDTIEEVEEEIANKMKFGFEFSGQLHNDD
jgi:hypothetical protein